MNEWCLGTVFAWGSAAVNMALAAWQITRWQRVERFERRQFEKWMAIEREQRAHWQRVREDWEETP